MSGKRLWFAVGLALLLAACGGGAPPPDLALSGVSPNSPSVVQGGSVALTLTFTSQNGFQGQVALSVTENGQTPSWLTLSPTSKSLNVPKGGQVQETLQVGVASNAPTGPHSLKLKATYGSKTAERDLTLTVNPPSTFALSDPSPNPVSVTQGSTATFQVTLTSQNGFQGEVSLSLADGEDPVPQGLAIAGTNPSPISLSPNAQVQVTVTLSADAQVSPNAYRLKLRAQGGSVTQEKPLTVNVQAAGSGPSLTWTPVFPAYEVAYGNGVFVAVGAAVLVSQDGANWEALNLPEKRGPMTRLSFVNGRFVAVEWRPRDAWNTDPYVWESTDGRSWTSHPFTPGASPVYGYGGGITHVVYNPDDGFYYTMAFKAGYTNQGPTRAGWLYRSQDLTNWTFVGATGDLNDPNSQFIPRDLAYGGGYFVAVGENVDSGGAVFASQGGQSWNQVAGGGIKLDAVAYGNGRFVAVGFVYGGGGLALASAPNDPTGSWTGLTPPSVSSVRAIFVTFDGTRFLTAIQGKVWAYDGTAANPNYATLPPYVDGGDIALGGGTYVVMGHNGFATSPNLTTWTATGFEVNHARRVACGSGKCVFAVFDYPVYRFAVADESAFPAWRVVATPSGGVYGLAFLNGYFIGVGQYGYVYRSQDGTSWTRFATPTNQDLSAVAYGNGAYVAVAYDGDIVYSQAQDASTWSLAQGTPTDRGFKGVAYGNGLFVAAGSVVYTSQDGVSWTAQTSPDPSRYMEDIAFGNGYFVMVSGDRAYRSQDGVNWQTVTLPGNAGAIRVVWTGSFFVAVGPGPYIATSTDGLGWTVQDTPFDLTTRDVAAGSQYLVAVAWGGSYGAAVARLP